LTVS